MKQLVKYANYTKSVVHNFQFSKYNNKYCVYKYNVRTTKKHMVPPTFGSGCNLIIWDWQLDQNKLNWTKTR